MTGKLWDSIKCRLKQGWIRFYLVACRPLRRALKLIRWLVIGLMVFFSPLIVWLILAVNRDLIHYLANSRWTEYLAPDAYSSMRKDVNSHWFVSGFNEAALGGLLTLFGVIVTVWYYHAVRQQEVVEKRLFVIDELLEELKKNKKLLEEMPNCQPHEKIDFFIDAWHKLGADVALLPRVLHLRLSVLYSSLMECATVGDYYKRKATVDRIPDILLILNKYRRKIARPDMS
jgi:hypothetical protein